MIQDPRLNKQNVVVDGAQHSTSEVLVMDNSKQPSSRRQDRSPSAYREGSSKVNMSVHENSTIIRSRRDNFELSQNNGVLPFHENSANLQNEVLDENQRSSVCSNSRYFSDSNSEDISSTPRSHSPASSDRSCSANSYCSNASENNQSHDDCLEGSCNLPQNIGSQPLENIAHEHDRHISEGEILDPPSFVPTNEEIESGVLRAHPSFQRNTEEWREFNDSLAYFDVHPKYGEIIVFNDNIFLAKIYETRSVGSKILLRPSLLGKKQQKFMSFFDFCHSSIKDNRASDYERRAFIGKKILGFVAGAKELSSSMLWTKTDGKEEIGIEAIPSIVIETCTENGSPKRKPPSRSWTFSPSNEQSKNILDCLETPLTEKLLDKIQKTGSRMPDAWIKLKSSKISGFEQKRKQSKTWCHSLTILDGISKLCHKAADPASALSGSEYKSIFDMVEVMLEESRRHLDPLAKDTLEKFVKERKHIREDLIGNIQPAAVKHALLSSDLFVSEGVPFKKEAVLVADSEAVKANKDFRSDRLAGSIKRRRSPSSMSSIKNKKHVRHSSSSHAGHASSSSYPKPRSFNRMDSQVRSDNKQVSSHPQASTSQQKFFRGTGFQQQPRPNNNQSNGYSGRQNKAARNQSQAFGKHSNKQASNFKHPSKENSGARK